MKQRDISINILKFFAVLAITNSHMDLLYGKYNFLATGGAIGDALFFFASGFTIFLGRLRSFDNYYKRRISRIYPTVFVWAILCALLFNLKRDFVSILLFGGGWFVSCIMIYYFILFFVRRYCFEHLKIVFVLSLFISAFLYVLFVKDIYFNMYGETYYKWCHFFIFMLQGAIIGVYSKKDTIKVKNGLIEMLKILVCIVVFYGLCAFKLSEELNYIQVLSLLPLLGIVYYIYRYCNSQRIKYLYNNTIVGYCMNIIGGLCLEIYLVQHFILTDKLNVIFPLNIPFVFIAVLFSAYLLRCFSRIWSQTFKEQDYDWKKIWSLL